MVSSEKSDFIRVGGLEAEKVFDRFNAVESAVDVVADKDIALLRDFSTHPEQLHQIIKLSMNVAAHVDRRADKLHIRLLIENLKHSLAQLHEIRLLQDGISLFQVLNQLLEVHWNWPIDSESLAFPFACDKIV